MRAFEDPNWQVADLIRSTEPVGPDMLCGHLLERLSSASGEPLTPIVNDGRPLGLIDRAEFLAEFAKLYRFDLFARKRVFDVMDFMKRPVLLLDAETTVETAHSVLAKEAAGGALPVGFIATTIDGRYLGTVLSLDVSRRLTELMASQNRKLMEAREQLARANEAKSDFLANMSHELRTPLNAIIGFSDVMQSQLFGTIGSERYASYVGDIHSSATHLLEMINELLDFSRIEAGQVELLEEPVDIIERIESALQLVRIQAEKAGVSVGRTESGALPMLICDAKKVLQVLINVLSNAVKFTPAGGSVAVSAEQGGDDEMIIAVSDTGIGISPDDLARVLSPFGRVESSYVRTQEGTGLGLPLAKRLVELHGGELTIESRVDVGTTVRIRLPSKRPDEGAPCSERAVA